MRRFVDLNLRVSIEDLGQVERILSKSSELGYCLVGIQLPATITREQVNNLRQISSNANVDLVTRVNFYPKTSKELLYCLRRFRRKFEVIGVTCASKGVARQAARDRRVDLLRFSSTNLRKRFFDKAEAQLASKALSSLEIEMAPLLSLTGVSRIHLLCRLRKEIAIAERYKVPVTISSGATSEYLMRSPQDYATLATLFDMPMASALRALSENPLIIIERNRKKLDLGYIAPGIRVVRWKRDV